MSIFDLTGEVAVVIGGTSGIGRAIGHALADFGADVVPVGRRAEQVEKTAAEIVAKGRKSLTLTADVASLQSINAMVQAVIKEFGKIDILVNSAGVLKKNPSTDVTEEEWDLILDTNLKGMFFACQAVGREMIKRQKGKIINIASIAGFKGLFEVAAYCASKGGVLALTRELAIEWAKYNVQVNAISPGVFRTPLNDKVLQIPERYQRIISSTPMGRVGKVEELGGIAVYLASRASDFTTGQAFSIDGGFLAYGI